MKSTAILSLCCAVLLVALGWVSTISVERIDSLKGQLTIASKNFTDCSAALVSAKSTAADLREQGTMSQANCVGALLAAQGLFELALPPAPYLLPTHMGAVGSALSTAPDTTPARMVHSDAAFTHFLNTF